MTLSEPRAAAEAASGAGAPGPTLPGAAAVPRPALSASAAWARALERTASIARNPERTLFTVVEEGARAYPDRPALIADRESFTYAELAARARRYARWALAQGLGKGDAVGLLMPNRPEYLAVWLGITSVGAIVALLNTNLTGDALAHSIGVSGAQHLIAGAEYAEVARAAVAGLSAPPQMWTEGRNLQVPDLDPPGPGLPDADAAPTPQPVPARPPVTVRDVALYIYTSGTTGLPKAAKVTHARILQWSGWFAGMMDARAEDRLYDCLPMYHSVGGVQAPGAMLVAGGSAVLRERFSASRFWADVARHECTIIQYIGELCRYLVHTAPTPEERLHRVRLACGNGLAPDVWAAFEERFGIPQILEFYAATEGSLSLFNVEGRRGAVGRVPPYLAHRFAPALVRVDPETGEPARGEDGLCVRVAPDEAGEAVSRLAEFEDAAGAAEGTSSAGPLGNRFEGYVDRAATERKLLRDVLKPGDCWLRTGDLMRRDAQGFFYFVDRIGDTFRWKGENVAASEVAAAIASFPGVLHATVYGVRVPGADGRAGMAAVVFAESGDRGPDNAGSGDRASGAAGSGDAGPDLRAFREYLHARLPSYARPLFLRLRAAAEVTGTFKYRKSELAAEGFDPSAIAATQSAAEPDRLYLDSPEAGAYVPLDAALYARIEAGQVRL